MNNAELEQYLHQHIPLSLAMQVSVLELTADKVVLCAPLAPNINHRDTVFGGSASAVAILAAWSMLNTYLLRSGMSARLVIQRNTMHYDLPIAGNFTASATLPDRTTCERFVRMLKRKGKARISIESALEYAGKRAGYLQGEFVALQTASV